MFLRGFRSISILSRRNPPFRTLRQFYHGEYRSPQRPRRDLYEDEEEGAHSDRGHKGQYERNWRDWIYDRRTTLFRAGMVAAGAGGYYWYHLEPTPITGRRRFMALSPKTEAQLAELSLRQIIQEYQGAILPAGHPVVRFVEKVTRRVLAAIDPSLLSPDTRWRIFVIDAPTANAFVLPGAL